MKEGSSDNKALYLTLGIAFVLFAIAVFLVVRYSCFLFVDPDNYHEVLRNIVLSIAALVSLPFVIWRAQANDRSSKASHRQSEVASRQIEIATESQINDRFTRAMEQLGSENLTIRIGGVHALGKIAEDSPRDAQTIIDILCTFVRDQTRNDEYKKSRKGANGVFLLPRADIQDAITVLGRGQFSLFHKNLERAYLPKVKMINADFSNTSFSNTVLHSTHIFNSKFENCTFFKTQMIKSKIEDVLFQNTNFVSSDMSDSVITSSTIEKTNMDNVILSGVNFSKTKFVDFVIVRSDVESIGFYDSEMKGGDLRGVVNLTVGQLYDITMDKNTQLPEHLIPKE